MKIGDYVRVLRGTEEGYIVRFLKNDLVEIETSDGFTLPVPAGDLVSVSPEESLRFGESKRTQTEQEKNIDVEKEETVVRQQITMLALVPDTGGRYAVWLSNATPCTMLYSAYTYTSKRMQGLSSGTLAPGQHENIGTLSPEEVQPGVSFVIQAIFHPVSSSEYPPPVMHRIRLAHLMKHGQTIYLETLNKKGYQLNLLENADALDADALRNSLLGARSRPADPTPKSRATATHLVVDLHIESLTDQYASMTGGEILELQLRTFEETLDTAITGNVKSIKFIHGIGNGTLRHRIHKKLGALKDLLYYEDADKERFGFGATTIHLK